MELQQGEDVFAAESWMLPMLAMQNHQGVFGAPHQRHHLHHIKIGALLGRQSRTGALARQH